MKQIKIIIIFIILINFSLFSDEGMWTLDNLPFHLIKEKYDYEITPGFLKKVRLGSVRFNDGGSGAFVSNRGLVITNHHVALGQIQKLSSDKNDYLKEGFLADDLTEELKCPDLEINVLYSMENITDLVLKRLESEKEKGQYTEIKNELLSEIEKKSFQETKLRSNVIEFYNGGEYWLYRYKKFTDVRLAFSPELQAASFGGEIDNFNFPRYALDFALFRVYENNKPFVSNVFFKLNPKGATEGELTFVSGHPGSTDRQKTLSEIKYIRDHAYPEYLDMISKKLEILREYSSKGKEEKRRAEGLILHLENSLKAIEGELAALNNPHIYTKLEEKEKNLKISIRTASDNPEKYMNLLSEIDSLQNSLISRKKEIYYRKISGTLPQLALKFILYARQMELPNAQRFPEYRDSNLDSLKHQLLSSAPIYKDRDILLLRTTLEMAQLELNPEDPFLREALGNQEPILISSGIIGDTQLDNLKYRNYLLKEGSGAILNSKDPILNWAKKIEPILSEDRKWYENEIQSKLSKLGADLSSLKFSIFGRSTYPDANFTLRLSYGVVKGLKVDGYSIPYKTTFYGLIERALGFGNKNAFRVAGKILKKRKKLRMSTPLNFISTHDITGGNSGSPMLNTRGEMVGLIFDGNTYSHELNYVYSEERARAVSVHSGAILESLSVIYGAKNLVSELRGR
ncbi:MAG: S46 family peptidase [Leptospiraceae bacterium]|nr:S46 family peptidase [Leptospiraceae bacterium]MCP5512068.1 S46 family peptidase [Leptospiraceae bacterium]